MESTVLPPENSDGSQASPIDVVAANDLCTNSKENIAGSSQSHVLTEAQLYYLQQQNDHLQQEVQLAKSVLMFSQIESDDKMVHHYTGLPTAKTIKILLQLINRFQFQYYMNWSVTKVSRIDQLLLTLMKLRLNLTNKDLAFRFNVDANTVTNIFVTYVSVLHEILFVGMDKLPTLLKNKIKLPQCFKSFPNTRVVLDCTEIEIAVPGSMEKKSQTFSHYKQRTTFKVLIGVLNLLAEGDCILADKSFLLKDILRYGVSVNVPPFLVNGQFTRTEAEITREIARARIHVEQVIGRVKSFRILSYISQPLRPHATKIFQLCCSLVNLQPPVLKC